jgi:hypothetical protein
MRKSSAAKGKAFDVLSEALQTIDQPLVEIQFPWNLLAFLRLYVKLALGIGHWLWGQTWSSSPDAGQLRSALWSTSLEQLNQVGLEVRPIKPDSLSLRLEPFEHCFLTCSHPTVGTSLSIFLFGGDGFVFRMASDGAALGTVCEPIAVLIDVTKRHLRRADLTDLVKEGRLAR